MISQMVRRWPLLFFMVAVTAAFTIVAKRRPVDTRMRARSNDGVPSEPVRAPRPVRGSSIRRKKKAPQQSSSSPSKLNRPSLRVIAGEAKGRKLESPETMLRPMMGKVKEAMFSTLFSLGVFRAPRKVAVLDTFCGSGSVGIEALSRGADFACFVDVSRQACDVALKNAQTCGFGERSVAVCDTAQGVLLRQRNDDERKFDVVSLTPPYEEISYADLLDDVCASNALNEDAVVVVEYPIELGALPPVLGDRQQLRGLRNRKHGRTVLAFYAHRPTGNLPFDFRPQEFDQANW